MTPSEDRRLDKGFHPSTREFDPFAAAMRAARMPMIITDPHRHDNPIIFVNDAFVALTGYSREETLGRNCRFLQGPGTNFEDVARLRTAIDERRAIEVDLLNYRKDGSLFWNRLSVSPVFEDGELKYFFASQFEVSRERSTRELKDQEELVREVERRVADLTASEERLHFTLKAGGLGTWTLDLPAQRLVSSALCKANFGRGPAETFSYDDLKSAIHPDDLDRWQAAVGNALRTDGNLRVEYRAVRPDGSVGWIEIRAETRFDQNGQPLLMNGVSIDITERKQTEVYRAMMAQEMGHRMKNMLATIQAIINQSMRSDPSLEGIRFSIIERVEALARSYDVLRGRDFDAATVDNTVQEAVRPFNSSGRIHFEGPDVLVSHQACTSLALAIHELATNAVKYGALSNETGRVSITWSDIDGVFSFNWKENGGPPVRKPARTGFGSRLIRMLGMSLSGSASIEYEPDGVSFTATTATSSLGAPA